MDWRDYGSKDMPALTAEIRKRNGNKKVTYVGHSQGTTQLLAGLGLIPEWYDDNVSAAVMLGPCDCPNTIYFKPVYTPENWQWLDDNGIYVIANTAGPSWEDNKKLIETEGPESLKAALVMLNGLPNNPT